MANEFSLAVGRQGDISVITLRGFVDAHTAPQFEDAMQHEIDTGRGRLVVDCTDLSYISSAGLGVFMGFVEETRDNGGDIKIAGVTDKVRQTFDLLGFDTIFDLVASVGDALRRFEAGKVGRDE